MSASKRTSKHSAFATLSDAIDIVRHKWYLARSFETTLEVHSTDKLIHGREHVKVGVARHLAKVFSVRQRRLRNRPDDLQPYSSAFDLGIAFIGALLTEIVSCKRTLQGEHVYA